MDKLQIISRALDLAKRAGDQRIMAACSRLIDAHRLGWDRHYSPTDWLLVKHYAEGAR